MAIENLDLGLELPDSTQMPELVKALVDAVDQCSSTVMLTSPDGIIRYVNRQFTMLTGYMADEVLGRTPRVLRSHNTPDAFYRTMWETITSGREFRGEIENRRKSGELYWENLSITPIKDAQGNVGFFLAIADNVTAKKQLERELHESFERLTQSNSRLQQFVSLVSHDLQGPLGNALMALEFIASDEDTKLSSAAEDVLGAGQSSLENAATLIRELLSFSRASKKASNFALTDLGMLFGALTETLYREIESSGAQIEIGTLPNIYGNSTLLRELFYNCLANAIKYRSSERPHIRVSAESVDGGVRIVIADNGMGIPQTELRKVIEPFTRGSNAGSLPGTGLGLALCKQIMDLHRGTLTLESEVGIGTKVALFFPNSAD